MLRKSRQVRRRPTQSLGSSSGRTSYWLALCIKPNTLPLALHDGETPVEVTGVSIVPDPAMAPGGHWRLIELNVTPKKNGIPTSRDTPVIYLVVLKHAGGEGLAFPSRYARSGLV